MSAPIEISVPGRSLLIEAGMQTTGMVQIRVSVRVSGKLVGRTRSRSSRR